MFLYDQFNLKIEDAFAKERIMFVLDKEKSTLQINIK